MKLHKTKAYEREGKPYFSWKVSLPPDMVAHLGWHDKEELEAIPRKGGIFLRPAHPHPDAQSENNNQREK